MKTKIIILAIVMAFVSLSAADILYSGTNDGTDRLSGEQSGTFSPGYINAAKQRTDAIIKQVNQDKNIFERAIDYINGKTSDKVNEKAVDRPVLELRKKSGGGGNSSSSSLTETIEIQETMGVKKAEAPEDTPLIPQKCRVGKGSDAVYDEDNRLISQYINGVKHIYVGFSNVGFASDGSTDPIQKAINMSNPGDAIIVSKGTYEGNLSLSEGVRLYGGFDDSGVRDLLKNRSIIIGDISVNDVNTPAGTDTEISELNGFGLREGKVYVYGGRFATVTCNTNFLRGVSIFGPVNSTMVVYDKAYYYSANSIMPGVTISQKISYGQQHKMDPSVLAYNENNVRTGMVFNMDSNTKSAISSTGKTFDIGNSLLRGKADNTEYCSIINTIKSDIGGYALAISAIGTIKETTGGEDGIKRMLAGILDNPNEDQKEMMGLVENLLNEANKMAENSSSPEAIKKASDDLIHAVAAILIAQAIPDLLTEGDISNIKDAFAQLDTAKGGILLEYQESIKPYHEEIKRVLSENISLLQLNNIVSRNMSEEELQKLKPNEIEKMLDKLRKVSDKSFEKDYILQQEAKYRRQYIDPSRKALEGKMKDMMREFTARLSKVLEGAKGKR